LSGAAGICQAWIEDEDGNAIQTEGVCHAPAEWISCKPFVGAQTCATHKCRCAKPLTGVLVVKPTDVHTITVDWPAMSPREVWAALKSAPPKIAGPWTKHEHSYGCDCAYAGPHFSKSEGYWYRPSLDGHEVSFDLPTKEESDASLRAEGWLLVD
jgi:hypothetical protein